MNSRPRIGNAPNPISRIGRRPNRCAKRPTVGEIAATMSCGTTMQAATSVVAQVLERMVTMLAISGSMAAFASWKMPTQTAKVGSDRLVRSRRSAAPVVAVRPRASPPCARIGSIWFAGMCASAMSVGMVSSAVTRKTAWLDRK